MKGTELINFEFNQSQVRTLKDESGEPWFVAKDVCDILEIINNRDAMSRLDDDEKIHFTKTECSSVGLTDTSNYGITFVNEAGLYTLILGSRKPEAKAFKRWITHEVIPAIRKTGGYVANEDKFVETYLPFADDATKLLFKTTLDVVRKQNHLIEEQKKKIEEDAPKVEFADAFSDAKTCIPIDAFANKLVPLGINTGQKLLFKWLRDNDYIHYVYIDGRKVNSPTKYSVNLGVLDVIETPSNDGIHIYYKVLITPKGQQYFYKKLKKIQEL